MHGESLALTEPISEPEPETEPEAEPEAEPEEEIIPEQSETVAASQPARPAQPAQPARPAQPAQPAQPARPAQPAQPARTSATTVRGRWSSFVDDRSTATLEFSVNNQGICTVIVDGSPMRLNPGRASINYQHPVNQGKTYTYVFEAWTEARPRSLTVINPSNYETNILISDTRRTFTITSRAMAETAQGSLRFLSANQTGTFFLSIVSITEQD